MTTLKGFEGSSVSPKGRPGTITVIQESDTITALDLEGEFDMSLSPQIIEHAQRVVQDNGHLIIDLSKTSFIDSSVIHALFEAEGMMKERGQSFVLQIGTVKGVERVLAIVGAEKLFDTAPTRAEAINLIKVNSKDRADRQAPRPHKG